MKEFSLITCQARYDRKKKGNRGASHIKSSDEVPFNLQLTGEDPRLEDKEEELKVEPRPFSPKSKDMNMKEQYETEKEESAPGENHSGDNDD